MREDEFNLLKEALCRMQAERDEARMELCKRDAAERTKSARLSGFSMRYLWQDIARERGWDCFIVWCGVKEKS